MSALSVATSRSGCSRVTYVALAHEPLRHGPFGDALAELGHHDVDHRAAYTPCEVGRQRDPLLGKVPRERSLHPPGRRTPGARRRTEVAQAVVLSAWQRVHGFGVPFSLGLGGRDEREGVARTFTSAMVVAIFGM